MDMMHVDDAGQLADHGDSFSQIGLMERFSRRLTRGRPQRDCVCTRRQPMQTSLLAFFPDQTHSRRVASTKSVRPGRQLVTQSCRRHAAPIGPQTGFKLTSATCGAELAMTKPVVGGISDATE